MVTTPSVVQVITLREQTGSPLISLFGHFPFNSETFPPEGCMDALIILAIPPDTHVRRGREFFTGQLSGSSVI
jgi:hypothetical protein